MGASVKITEENGEKIAFNNVIAYLPAIRKAK